MHSNKLTDLISVVQKCVACHPPSTHCPRPPLPPPPPPTSSSSSGGCDGAAGDWWRRGLCRRSRRGAGWCLEHVLSFVRSGSHDCGGREWHGTNGVALERYAFSSDYF